MEKPHILAFYLPQYRPVKENNEWFGEGFTEWTNVAKAKPLFKGHHQPKVPSDLGFYDLRIPEVREKQAELAKEAGVTGFCYYHYWFGNGTKILHETLEEVVATGKPDLPFCLCWANHSWYKKNWNPDTQSLEQNLLLEQLYPGKEDIVAHFKYLLPIFQDKRYYKIDGKLVFVIYDIPHMTDYDLLVNVWNQLAKENNLPEFYFIGYTVKEKEITHSDLFKNTDGVILSMIAGISNKQDFSRVKSIWRAVKFKVSSFLKLPLDCHKYEDAIKYMLSDASSREDIIPTIAPNWDYTARRGAGGLILTGATPELFKQHAQQALSMLKQKPPHKRIAFIKSWNEWGEGNYMEPDLKYGKGHIIALKEAIAEVFEK